MKNRKQHVLVAVILYSMIVSSGVWSFPVQAFASDGEDYITISVDAVDDNPNLQYAIDSDAPSAFSETKEFTVPAGTSHTIYVKDAAGNITSQRYEPEQETDYDLSDPFEDGEQEINIDLELGRKEILEDGAEESGNPGTASVTSRVKTDGSVDAEKVFYTFTTKEGVELYLVVDQSRGSDNVYLLDKVSLADLRILADSQESTATAKPDNDKEDNLLSILAGEGASDDEAEGVQQEKQTKGTSSFSSGLIILLLAGVGGGLYYYLKIYRNKKDEVMDALDAMDMEDFEAGDEEDEEVNFDYDDAEKERYLESLLNEEEESEYIDADPDEYAASHLDGNDGEDESDSEDFLGEDEVVDEDPFDDMEIGL